MIGKAELLAAIAPTNRGILATPEQQVAINAAAVCLEERNPTANPTAAAALLNGDWRLLYTSSSELLGINRLPLTELGQIYQCIRSDRRRVYNIAETRSLPYLEGLVSVVAGFEVASPQRLSVRFERAVFGLQRLANYPGAAAWIERLESGQRLTALDFPIRRRESPGWIDLTYLDDQLRINRGNAGSLFVLQRA
ncbi:MAG: fibrillin [Synechococcales cyanobacterium RM1_1_8]|nr:fibrillin [Synechococcales cyanobacterium RM1_1_8]